MLRKTRATQARQQGILRPHSRFSATAANRRQSDTMPTSICHGLKRTPCCLDDAGFAIGGRATVLSVLCHQRFWPFVFGRSKAMSGRMKTLQSVLYACLVTSCGCGTQPTVPVSNETADSSKSPPIPRTEKLANRIIPVSEEQSGDPSLKLTPENDQAINLIRTWVTMQGVQFDESALGYCD